MIQLELFILMQNPEFPELIYCHLLIGSPGSGKSTIATDWLKQDPNLVWVSTDRIRENLYGDANIQGPWADIQTVVLQEIQTAIEAGRSVIYDATNVRRSWRMGFLQQLQGTDWLANTNRVQWIAWRIETPLSTCLRRNRSRDRQVPQDIIERFYGWMETEEVQRSEGFVAVNSIPLKRGKLDYPALTQLITSVPTQLKQRQNRYRSLEQHPFSNQLAFEQLMILISVLLGSPGIENIDKISQKITEQYSSLYAEKINLEWNLNWLMNQGLVNSCYSRNPFQLDISANQFHRSVAPEFAHAYSDRSAFIRLMETIRFLVHHPVISTGYDGVRIRDRLLEALRNQGIEGYSADAIRRDIQLVLKPYKIMSDQNLRKGYFMGTAILSEDELLQLYQRFAGQTSALDDPIACTLIDKLQQRLQLLGKEVLDDQPIQLVVNQPIVNPKYLPLQSLAQPEQSSCLEQAIRSRQIIQLHRIFGTGRFPQDRESIVSVIPLQIIFYNIAWYLGYQRSDNLLFQFERLDRLSADFSEETIELKVWQRLHKQLEQLRSASYGLFLGLQARDQQDFLSSVKRSSVEVHLELWFDDAMFKFVSEGTQRFPKLAMSPRQSPMSDLEKRDIFTLSGTGDPQFPHRLVATVPKWSIDGSIDLMTWLLGFGGQMRVVAPDRLRDRLFSKAREILNA
jgi:predicted kinase